MARRILSTAAILLVGAVLSVVVLAGCSGPQDDVSEPATRLIIFAIDAANWNTLTPMLEAGELPNIAGLLHRGSYGVLKSGVPIQSPQMWTSIATGVVPERHGITRFVAELPGGTKEVPVTNNMRRVKAFWNILSERDISVGIVGWWPSWPVDEVEGFMIAQRAWPVNWSLHGIPFGAARNTQGRLITEDFPGRTWPESLYEEFEGFIVTEEDVAMRELDQFFADSRFTDPAKQFHARWVYAKDKTFADAGLHFLVKEQPQIFAVYLQGTDVVSHYYWGYQEEEGFTVRPDDARMYGRVVKNYYIFIDRTIGRYLETVDDRTAVLLVSDHGFETKQELKTRWERGERIRTEEGGKDVPWDHGADGVIIFAGPGVKAGHRMEDEASVVDVTPTLLAYLGLPAAQDMDGRPLVDCLEETFLSEHPIQWIPTYETGGQIGSEFPIESPIDEGIREKLRSLGYIE